MCGGTAITSRRWPTCGGLSPRVRGNRQAATATEPGERSIPACAGEPTISRPRNPSTTVYPRVCGEPAAGYAPGRQCRVYPRVCGGTMDAGNSLELRGGSIPACAGEPGPSSCPFSIGWVYPRVCGGTYYLQTQKSIDDGLSPRVRGEAGNRAKLAFQRHPALPQSGVGAARRQRQPVLVGHILRFNPVPYQERFEP